MHTRLLSLAVMLLVLSIPGLAQDQYNITGAGARAMGLGGAFIGLADDATAISWNPSGLGQLERTEASVVGRWIEQKYEYSEPSASTNNFKMTLAHFAYNFASIAFPLHAGKVNIVPAVAYQAQLDNYYKFNTETISVEGSGGANTITPGIGIKLHSMFYIGAAANIWLGNAEDKQDWKDQRSKFNFDGTYSGLNFTAGLLLDFEGLKKPIPIKFGASLRTPFDLTIEGDYTYTTLSAGTADQKGKYKRLVQMPFMVGFGASGRIGENFTLSADFEMRLYGDQKSYWTIDGEKDAGSKMSESGSNLNQVRVGAEYLIVTTAGVIPLRAGFRTEPTLMADYSDNGAGSQVIGTGFTVGTGFISGSFALDVAYARSTSEQKYTSASATNSSSYDYTTQVVSASLIIYF